MQHTNRPSHKELDGKLKGAKEALEKKPGMFADPSKVPGELEALGIDDSKEVWGLILKLLPEIKSDDYEGRRPPEKSYEPAIKDEELFPFCWESTVLARKMYLKFALDDDQFWYVSLHQSKY